MSEDITRDLSSIMNGELEGKVEEIETDTARLRRILSEKTDFRECVLSIVHDMNNLLTVITGYAELAKNCPEDASKYCGLLAEHTDIAAELVRKYSSKIESLQIKSELRHNMNNALQPISGFAGLGKANPERFCEYSLPVFDGVAQASRFITELQSYANADVLKEKQQVNIRFAVETALESICSSGIAVSRKYASETPYASAIEYELLLVYKSIIKNSLEAGANSIAVSVYQKDEKICTSISDNGAGISKEKLEKIFEPFHTTKFQNLGLGLATSKIIIEKYGGRILVESQPGSGSSFTVELPACEKKDS